MHPGNSQESTKESRVKHWHAWTLAVLLAALPLTAAEKDQTKDQDVEALIAKGQKAYKDGKTADAIVALQAAITAIQKAQEKGLAKFLPTAPEGWEAGKVDSSSYAGSGGGGSAAISNISCKYTKKDQKETSVTVALIATKEMVEGQKSLIDAYKKDPAILKAMQTADTSFALVDQDGWAGWRTADKRNSSAQLFAICKSVMLTVEVRKGDAAALDQFFKAMDLKGLAAVIPAVEAPAKE